MKQKILLSQDADFSNSAINLLVSFGCATFEPMGKDFEDIVYSKYPDLFKDSNIQTRKILNQLTPEGKQIIIEILKLTEEEKQFVASFNQSNAHSLFLLPIGSAIAFAHLENLGVIQFDWTKAL